MTKPLRIASFCSPFLLTVEQGASLKDVMTIMDEADVRHIPVVLRNEPVGLISERELKVFGDKEFAEQFCAGDVMVPAPYCVSEDTDLRMVIAAMIEKKYGSCLVKDDNGKISGIFTMVDALKTLKIMLNKLDQSNTYLIEHT